MTGLPPEILAALQGFAALLGLIVLRCPIALAMLLVGGVGYAQIAGWQILLNYLKGTPYHLFANYTLSVIPLFVLMGAIAERAGLAGDLFAAAEYLFGRKRGGPAIAVIVACGAFGAVCGSSVATTATFARAALPELRRLGYAPGFAAGLVSAGGTLGILIPPSVILVIYAIVTEQNIARLFLAALLPGLLAVLLYALAVALAVRLLPELGGQGEGRGDRAALRRVVPVLGVGVIVLGGIYGGVFTPTEGASVGAVAMLAVALARRGFGFWGLAEALRATAETSGMIFAILLGANLFNAFLALTQAPDMLQLWLEGLDVAPVTVLVAILAIYILLGAVMDELAMILLTLPVFFPLVVGLDFGLARDEVAIWFGVLVLVVVGMGLISPPVGLNVFVAGGIARDVALPRIFGGVLPFLLADAVKLALCVALPSLSLGLVRAFGGV